MNPPQRTRNMKLETEIAHGRKELEGLLGTRNDELGTRK